MSRELEEFIEYLIKERGLSESSVSFYRSDLIQFEEFLDKSIIKANSNDVVKFLSTIKKSEDEEDENILNKRTLNRKLSSINAFFKFSYKKEWMDNRLKVKQFKLNKQLPKFLTIDEIKESLKNIESDNWLALRDKALILFLYATGLTVSEAMNVKKSDIEEGWVKVKNKNKERIVPIAKVALKALSEYLFKRPHTSEYLFINSRGKKLSRISAFNITKKYLKVSPHILRHSFATSLILGGVKLKVIQELLGHSCLITTKIYSGFQKNDIYETVEKFHPLKELDE